MLLVKRSRTAQRRFVIHCRELSQTHNDSESNHVTVTEDQLLRNTQAAEVFRAAFYRNASGSISTNDLDEMMHMYKARPSLLLGAYQMSGAFLGAAAKLSPSKDVSNFIANVVQESTVQQFNDNIRDMNLSGVDNIDIKETIKYHRDLDIASNINSNTPNTNADNKGEGDSLFSTTASVALLISGGIQKFLRCSRDL